MSVALIHFRDGAAHGQHEGNASGKGEFASFVAFAISLAWQRVGNVYFRNALAQAAKYVGMQLPRLDEPQRKPTIETVVFGAKGDRAQKHKPASLDLDLASCCLHPCSQSIYAHS